MSPPDLAESLAASTETLRRTFDAAFAAPHPEVAPDGEQLLGIRLAGEAFALPIAGKSARISGLAADLVPAPLPNRTRACRGLIAVRGEIFPAFDLATITGLASGDQRWWALLRLPAPAAVSFESLRGLLELPASQLLAVSAGDSEDHSLSMVSRIARVDGQLIPVLDLDAIADAIRRLAANPPSL